MLDQQWVGLLGRQQLLLTHWEQFRFGADQWQKAKCMNEHPVHVNRCLLLTASVKALCFGENDQQ